MPLPFNHKAMATLRDWPGEHSCAPYGHRGVRRTQTGPDSHLRVRLEVEPRGRASMCRVGPASEPKGPRMGVFLPMTLWFCDSVSDSVRTYLTTWLCHWQYDFLHNCGAQCDEEEPVRKTEMEQPWEEENPSVVFSRPSADSISRRRWCSAAKCWHLANWVEVPSTNMESWISPGLPGPYPQRAPHGRKESLEVLFFICFFN